ncbi:MAG: hypothetical protein KKC99_11965, partial [Proteobacteria bacterium]|nr:hypothetical protein [Pseudomonadota bacterium]
GFSFIPHSSNYLRIIVFLYPACDGASGYHLAGNKANRIASRAVLREEINMRCNLSSRGGQVFCEKNEDGGGGRNKEEGGT